MGALKYDIEKAAKLQSKLQSMETEMKKTLDRIGRTVEKAVNDEWKGTSSPQAFIDLYATSSGKVHEYLKEWLVSIGEIIDATTKEKLRQDEELKNSIRSAGNQIAQPNAATI